MGASFAYFFPQLAPILPFLLSRGSIYSQVRPGILMPTLVDGYTWQVCQCVLHW